MLWFSYQLDRIVLTPYSLMFILSLGSDATKFENAYWRAEEGAQGNVRSPKGKDLTEENPWHWDGSGSLP